METDLHKMGCEHRRRWKWLRVLSSGVIFVLACCLVSLLADWFSGWEVDKKKVLAYTKLRFFIHEDNFDGRRYLEKRVYR